MEGRDLFYIQNLAAALASAKATSNPDLTLAKMHSGSFTQGQIGTTYEITVSKVGTAITMGSTTVTDTLPIGLTATVVNGSGWNCRLGTLSCSPSDSLPAGARPVQDLEVRPRCRNQFQSMAFWFTFRL
jgi:hypothetical protein